MSKSVNQSIKAKPKQRVLKTFLSGILLATCMPLTATSTVNASEATNGLPIACTPDLTRNNDYLLNQGAFFSCAGYFKELNFDLSSTIKSYTDQAQYEFEEAEFAIFDTDGVLVNYVGATKNKEYTGNTDAEGNKEVDNATSYRFKVDLGNPKSYDENKQYQVKYRLVFTVLIGEVQYKKSKWVSYDQNINDSNDGNGTFFKVTTPKPASPLLYKMKNRSYIKSSNAPYFIGKLVEGNEVASDTKPVVRNGGSTNTVVLTDKTDVTLDYTTTSWYTHRVERTITTPTGDPKTDKHVTDSDNESKVKKTVSLRLTDDVTKHEANIESTLFRDDVKDTTIGLYKFTDKSNVTIIRDIFNTLFDLKITTSGTSHSVTLTQKTGLDATTRTMLNNSMTEFGLDLNKPSFTISDNASNGVDTHKALTAITNLGTAYTKSCAECKNPNLVIGYPGMQGGSYTAIIPLKDILNINFSNIQDNGVVKKNSGKFKPEVSIKQTNNIFKFPEGSSFDWEKYKSLGTKLEVFVVDTSKLTSIPADKTTLFAGSSTNFVYKSTITSKETDTFSKLEIDKDGSYLIGARLTNKYGDVKTEFKEFKLLFSDNYAYMPVSNNFNYQFDNTSLISNGDTIVHGLNVTTDNALTVPSAYNYKNNVTMIASIGTGKAYGVYDSELKEVAIQNALPTGTMINSIVEYKDGFLLGVKSTSDASLGLMYLDAKEKTITKIITTVSEIKDIKVDSGILYLGGKASLSIGKITDNKYVELDSISTTDIFKTPSAIGTIDLVGNQIFVTPVGTGGSNGSKVTVLDKI